MIVVADSGPLHYLILLGQTELLPRFYGQVIVPEKRSLPDNLSSLPMTWISVNEKRSFLRISCGPTCF